MPASELYRRERGIGGFCSSASAAAATRETKLREQPDKKKP
jgi:hypothetical protein